MSRPRLRISRIVGPVPDEKGEPIPGIDGRVEYEVLRPDSDEVYFWVHQHFARGVPSGAKVAGYQVWRWEGGSLEAPTLTPSFLCWAGEMRMHLYLRDGKIQLLDDSTVELMP